MDDNEVEATIDLVHQAAMAGVDSVFKSEDWRKHPIFLNELPEDIENDKYLGAFQHVTYDGETPDSLAKNFKEIGNELFRQGKNGWLAAANWWSRALEEKMTDKKLRSILHSNRATVSLGLGQYQRAVLDANWAIENDKYNKKAYVRAAHAYQGLGNWDKAIEAANAGLEIIEEENPLRKQLNEVLNNCKSQKENGYKRVTQYFTNMSCCGKYLTAEKVAVGEFSQAWQGNWDIVLQFDEDKNEAIWPIAIAYDEVLQVDFCEAFGEKTSMEDLIAMILPGKNKDAKPPLWDEHAKRYTTETAFVYVKTNTVNPKWGKSVKRGKSRNILIEGSATLKDILKQNDYVVPGYPIIYVAVFGSAFSESLSIEESVVKGGKRRKLTVEEKNKFIAKPENKDEEDVTLPIDKK